MAFGSSTAVPLRPRHFLPQARIEAVSEATALLQRRNELLLEEAALIEALNDPGRLVSKQRGIAQQLLKEEKMRRALRVEMPKINAKLRRFATEWAEKHGEAFIYRGDVLLDVLPQPEPETAVLGTGVRRTPRPSASRSSHVRQCAPTPARPGRWAASIGHPDCTAPSAGLSRCGPARALFDCPSRGTGGTSWVWRSSGPCCPLPCALSLPIGHLFRRPVALWRLRGGTLWGPATTSATRHHGQRTPTPTP